jgi:hypothetical protein
MLKVMTGDESRKLRDAWKIRGACLCEHKLLELERTPDGYVTGNYYCMCCDEAAICTKSPEVPVAE